MNKELSKEFLKKVRMNLNLFAYEEQINPDGSIRITCNYITMGYLQRITSICEKFEFSFCVVSKPGGKICLDISQNILSNLKFSNNG